MVFNAYAIAYQLVYLRAYFRNKSETLQVTTKYNITCFTISPDGCVAILVDEGMAHT